MINRDLFLAILAMDAYNRGYGQGLLINPMDSRAGQNEINRRIGNAKIVADTISDIAQSAGFYAIAYDVSEVSGLAGYSRVIS